MQAGLGSVRRWRQQSPFQSGGGRSAPAQTAPQGPQTRSPNRPYREPVAGTPSAARQLTAWGPHQENAGRLHRHMVGLMDTAQDGGVGGWVTESTDTCVHSDKGAETWTVRTSLKLDMVLQGLWVLGVRQHVQVAVWIHTGSS